MRAATPRAHEQLPDDIIRLNGAGDHSPEKLDPEAFAFTLMCEGRKDDDVRVAAGNYWPEAA